MSEQSITQAMMVADWNTRHPEVVPVDFFMDGSKIQDHKVTTSSYAYLNEFQMACIKINIEDVCYGLEVKIDKIKPIKNEQDTK